jgi:hypothetical protein
MFYAKAMYQGGAIIVSADEKLDYSSYTELGLRCLECGEEVHLRRGDSRRPHFAHFMVIDSREKECSLRVISCSGSWSGFTLEGRGQRRNLFQEHFISLIQKQHSNFDRNIQIIQETIPNDILDKISKESLDFFYENKPNFIIKFRNHAVNYYNNDLGIHFLTVSEAIDYLSLKSSQDLFYKLLYYSIYQCCYTSKTHIFNNLVDKNLISHFIELLINFIKTTNWLGLVCFEELYKTGGNLRLPSQEYQSKEVLLEKLENYFHTETRSLNLRNSKAYNCQLKLNKLDIDIYTLQIVTSVLGQKPRQAYRHFITVANITNIDINSNKEIVIALNLKYEKSICESYQEALDFYNSLKDEIPKLLTFKAKKEQNECIFRLTNWEQIEELIEELGEHERQIQRKKRRQEALKKKWRERRKHNNMIKLIDFLEEEFHEVFYQKYEEEFIECPICEHLLKQKQLINHIIKCAFNR